MKLSDIITELQNYIFKEGNKEINSIDITNDKASVVITRLNSILVSNDNNNKVNINFYELKQSK